MAFSIILFGAHDRFLRWEKKISNFLRLLLPYHKAISIRPAYFSIRLIYHVCLFTVPVWFSGHIVLWEESRFEWTWTPLPDVWIDWMTISVLLLTLFFLLRRCLIKHARIDSTASDYLLLIITGLPFLTGYFLIHGTLDFLPHLSDYLLTMHILSGEVFLLAACFLFYRTRLNALKCTGCAACTISCPTETLESIDDQKTRSFTYSHYQCICCGECESTCPEGAVGLRHVISFRKFFQAFKKYEIQRVDLTACEICGTYYLPAEQLNKIRLKNIDNYVRRCPACKQTAYAENFSQTFFNKTGSHLS
jgi:NAD-dependent dihydropyrimidine dehydrogenase PreA subunit